MKPTRDTNLDELLGHSDWIRRLAGVLVRDPSERADVEQQTWLAFLSQPDGELRNPRAWLAAVVRNIVRQRNRSTARRERRDDAFARQGAAADSESTARLVEETETFRILVDAVLALDEPFRSAVMLRYFRDQSAAAIAEQLGVPASTVRTRLTRGLELLRDRLDHRFGDRRSWVAVVLPIAHRAAPSTAVGAVSAPSMGVLLAILKWIAASSVVVIVVAAVWTWRSDSRAHLEPARPSSLARPNASVEPAPFAPAATRESAEAENDPASPAPRPAPRYEDMGFVGTEQDERLAGVAVRIERTDPHTRDTEPSWSMTSRADGGFKISAAAPRDRSHRLVARFPGFVTAYQPLGEQIPVIRLKRSATIVGVVTDETTGLPVADVLVDARPNGQSVEALSCRTDGRGAFRIEGVPPARTNLMVALPRATQFFVEANVPGPVEHRRDIVIPRGGILRGRFVDAATRDGLAGTRSHRFGFTGEEAAADGSFELRVIDWSMPLWFEREGYSDCSYRPPNPQPVDADLGDVPLFRGCRLVVRVLDLDAAPVPNVTVRANAGTSRAVSLELDWARVEGLTLSSFSMRQAVTDADGRAVLESLSPFCDYRGVRVLRADPQGWINSEPFRFDAAGQTRELTVTLATRATIAGTGRVGAAAARGSVQWKTKNSGGSAPFDERGDYRIALLEAGEVQLSAQFLGRPRGEQATVIAAPGATLRQDFAVGDVSLTLRGRCITPTVERSRDPVLLRVLSGGPATPTTLGEGQLERDGRFEIRLERARPGDELLIEAIQFGSTTSYHRVIARESPVDITLPECATVRLVLSGSDAGYAVRWRTTGSDLPFAETFLRGDAANGVEAELPLGRIDLEIGVRGAARVPREGSPTAVILRSVSITASGTAPIEAHLDDAGRDD